MSEILFTNERANTWFQANALMIPELGTTPFKVTLHGSDRH